MATRITVPDRPLTPPGARPGLGKRAEGRGNRFNRPGAGTNASKPQSRRVSLWDEQQKQRAVVEMLPLVKRVALKVREHLPSHVEVDDLVGTGTLGLVDAVGKFDASRGVKLESYARHRIRGAILDGLRSIDPASRDMRKKSKRLERVYREQEARLQRPINAEEMCRALGVSLDRWHHVVQELHGLAFDLGLRTGSARSADALRASALDRIPSPQPDPFELCYRREQRDLLHRALAYLPERERLIIALYYQGGMTMKQIATRLNVDESRISQLHAAALLRLKTRVQALLHPRKLEAFPATTAPDLLAA